MDEGRTLMTAVPGFRTYVVVETGHCQGGVSFIVGKDKSVTDEVSRRMAEFVQSRQDAGALICIDRSTDYRARQADPAFAAAIDQAEAAATQTCVSTIWKAVKSGDAKWAAWWLAHRRPHEWGDYARANDTDRQADTELGSLLRSLDSDRSIPEAVEPDFFLTNDNASAHANVATAERASAGPRAGARSANFAEAWSGPARFSVGQLCPRQPCRRMYLACPEQQRRAAHHGSHGSAHRLSVTHAQRLERLARPHNLQNP